MEPDAPAIAVFIDFDEDIESLPDPNTSPNMIGEVLAVDWTPDGDR